MSLKEEIEKYSVLLSFPKHESYYYVPRIEAKKEKEYQQKLTNAVKKTKEISEGLEFPMLNEFVKEYLELYGCYIEALKYNPLKYDFVFLKEYKELVNLLNSNPEFLVTKIIFKTDIGETINLTNKEIISKILHLARNEYVTERYMNLVEELYEDGAGNSVKWTTYRKEFINGFYPLYKHLKKYNENVNVYDWLRKFLKIFDFDTDVEYPDSVDPDPFKSYFTILKGIE